MHYTEGTTQYYEMVDELAKVVEDSNAPVEVKKRIGDLSKRLEAIKKDYQGDTEGMNEALKQYVYQTEGVADLIGDLLAQEQYITRLAQRNEGFVKKLLTKIKALANKSAKVDSEATKYLNKLVKSFEKAIDSAHGGVSLNSIDSADEEKEEVVNVRYSKSNEKSSIRMQLKNSAEIINEMQPVAIIDVKIMSKKEAFDFVIEEFKKFGYQVERQNFGKIEIGKKEINDSLNYLNQESEILALLTVPKVLKRGILIDGHDNHKGRNYETVTIAAPVVINGTRGNVGVVVKKGGKNKYKTHRILMPDGSEFVFETKKDTEPTSAGVKGEIHRQGPAISSVLNDSIPQNGENVNSNERKSKKRSYTPEHQIEKYQKEIDNWDRETIGFSFVIGEATEIISNIDIDGSKIGNKQIRIDAAKVKKILSEHQTMSIEVIKELPYLINDPILILDSLTQKGRIILLGEVYDEAGMPVMLILEPNPKTKNKKSTYVNVIKVASAYGKGKLQSLIERSNIKYISKNKSRANNWLKVNRLQLPFPNTQYGSATNSIDQNSEKINTFDENNLDERKSKKRSYNPTENADFEDEGNVWVEDEQDGVKVIFSTPDFSNPNYEKNHAPGYRLSDTYDGDNPEAYVIEGKNNILSENSQLKKFVADNIKLKKYSRKDASNILFEIMNEKGYFDGISTKFKGKSKAEIERMLWDALNVKGAGQRGGAALDIADAIITNFLYK